ncbi:MAG: energy transducer TonB [Acidobacteriota bacterium]|jgi:rhodanese-related sulfurtransferase
MRKLNPASNTFQRKKLRNRSIILLAFGALYWHTGIGRENTSTQDTLSTSEAGLRRMAQYAPKPAYPSASIEKKKSGVAVASVLTGVDGNVETVVVLEAPDDLIGSAVREAVMQWKFTPSRLGGPDGPKTRTYGKLTFYYRITNGAGQVLSPDEMPGAQPPASSRPSSADMKPGVVPSTVSVSAGDPIPIIDSAEIDRLLAKSGPTVLDIRERDAFRLGHRKGAVNLPTDELSVRAPIELPMTKAVIIDCSQAEEGMCRIAGQILQRKGFSQVVIFKQ